SRFRPVDILDILNIESFRTSHFNLGVPALLRNQFRHIPAISRWFNPYPSKPGFHQLNAAYLEPHGSVIVPLELTRATHPLSDSIPDDAEYHSQTFQRFEAPLSVFLAASSSPHASPGNLYLAQCSLDSLPLPLQADLPTPDVILKVGKGDLYANSLWLGRPPTRTPLHRDPNPNIFVQLAGQKVVRLLEPEIGRAVYERSRSANGHANIRGQEMMEGQEMERLEDAVWGENGETKGWEAILGSGDGLFIPKGWWHSVRSFGDGISGSVNWWFR
ncbi:Clavaminate synthase-like protein, partial [Lophium mytilinum]